jgi:putative transcriptional regulator
MKKTEFSKLVASVKQAGKIRRGEMKASRVFDLKPVDVRAIRNKLGVSQGEFASMIGVSVSTLQNWEQGRRRPEGPAQALLKVAAFNPQAVVDALAR